MEEGVERCRREHYDGEEAERICTAISKQPATCTASQGTLNKGEVFCGHQKTLKELLVPTFVEDARRRFLSARSMLGCMAEGSRKQGVQEDNAYHVRTSLGYLHLLSQSSLPDQTSDQI